MLSFTFRGKNSYTDFGIIIKKRPPVVLPERRIEHIEVLGRHGTLTIDDETYKQFQLQIECAFVNSNYMNKAHDIKKWLMGGYDKLIFSDESDKYYIAQVANKVDIVKTINAFREFIIIFDCQPFAYAVDNNVIALTAPGSIFNPGTVDSEPIITVYGSGDITLTINGENIYLYNVTDYITIDSVLMDAYKDTVLKNNDMLGEFPELTPGENSISWIGNVTKIEITPNWRWL